MQIDVFANVSGETGYLDSVNIVTVNNSLNIITCIFNRDFKFTDYEMLIK